MTAPLTRDEAERRIADGIVAVVRDAAPLVRRMVDAMTQAAIDANRAAIAKQENPDA